MQRKKLAAAVLAVLLAGCGEDAREKLKLGMILSTTGSSSATGTRQVEAATLATEEINAKGGVLGKDLEFVYRDDASDKTKAPGLAQELVAAGVPAILGSGSSSITLAIADVAIPAHVVQIAGSSTSPLITSKADDGYLFRTAPSDALQGKLLAQRARAQGRTDVAIVHAPGAYGEGLAAAFEQELVSGGGTARKVAYVERESQATYSAMLADLYAAGVPQAIVLVATVADGAKIVKAYVTDHHLQRNSFWYFTDAVSVSDFVTGVGASSFDTLAHEGTQPGIPASYPRFDAFAAAYQARFGKAPEVFAANAYDAVYLLALGLEAAGKAEGAALRDQLTSVSAGGQAFGATEYPQAVEALRAGSDVDYVGASGAVDFDGQGDVTGGYNIWKVSGGALTVTARSVAVE